MDGKFQGVSGQVEDVPGKSLGMFALGMTRQAAGAIPGVTEFGKGARSRPAIGFREQFIHLHFSNDDEVAEIEAGGDADAVLAGVRVLRRPLSQVLAELGNAGIVLTRDRDGADAPSLGVGLYAPHETVEGVTSTERARGLPVNHHRRADT